jgi:hypothetical protein
MFRLSHLGKSISVNTQNGSIALRSATLITRLYIPGPGISIFAMKYLPSLAIS